MRENAGFRVHLVVVVVVVAVVGGSVVYLNWVFFTVFRVCLTNLRNNLFKITLGFRKFIFLSINTTFQSWVGKEELQQEQHQQQTATTPPASSYPTIP